MTRKGPAHTGASLQLAACACFAGWLPFVYAPSGLRLRTRRCGSGGVRRMTLLKCEGMADGGTDCGGRWRAAKEGELWLLRSGRASDSGIG
jgi:hypothetical protein